MNMRKFCILVSLSCALALCGCSKTNEYSLSELRDGYYTGSKGGFSVTAISGARETPYQVDGVVNPLTPYTLITIEPSNFDSSKQYGYKVEIGENSFVGTFIAHPFAPTYSAELSCDADGRRVLLAITDGENVTALELENRVTGDCISAADAVAIAAKKLSPPKSEIYARLTEVPIGTLNWYVRFSSERTLSALIDIHTGEVKSLSG